MKQATIFLLSTLTALAHGHGFVTTPKARMPGSAMAAACGQQVAINQESDNYGNIQGELQVASSQSDYKAAPCDIWLCKGYKFADNSDNVHSYQTGQTVDFVVDIRAPHTGVANVSIVNTASNSVIAGPLISWTDYASVATGVKKNQTNFSITIPTGLDGVCAKGGDCVIQWYWYAQSIDQTYESCVDFTLDGEGDSGTTTTTTTAAVVTTAAPTTLTTSVKPTTTAAPTSTTATVVATAIPKDGTPDEQLHWVATLLQTLLNRWGA